MLFLSYVHILASFLLYIFFIYVFPTIQKNDQTCDSILAVSLLKFAGCPPPPRPNRRVQAALAIRPIRVAPAPPPPPSRQPRRPPCPSPSSSPRGTSASTRPTRTCSSSPRTSPGTGRSTPPAHGALGGIRWGGGTSFGKWQYKSAAMMVMLKVAYVRWQMLCLRSPCTFQNADVGRTGTFVITAKHSPTLTHI